MKLSFIGTGYVGLVSATAFAESGNQVTCVDVDASKVNRLKSGELTIYEPGLQPLFDRNIREGRLSFTLDFRQTILKSEVIFLTLPTPPQEDGSADLSYVMKTVSEMAAYFNEYKIIVTKSTVPVGTADRISSLLECKGLKEGKHFDVVSNPEFLREGSAIQDFMKPERVVIGTKNKHAADIMSVLYEPFVRNGNPIQVMDPRSSELVKYASNGFLAMKISFINEIANLCSRVGADVEKVRSGMGKDSRIGSQFLYAGMGYGGSCFPKDVQALSHTSKEHDYDFQILNAVMDVNNKQRNEILNQVIAQLDGNVKDKKIAFWGLSFKPNTDDIREAPALWLIEQLSKRGAKISAFDPEAIDNTRMKFGNGIEFGKNQYDILEKSDCLVICTEWNEFRNPDFSKIMVSLKDSLIIDGRNLYEPSRMAEMGFRYHSVGRPYVKPTAKSCLRLAS